MQAGNCPALNGIADGMVSYSMLPESNGEYPEGTVATFSCDAGTELFGDTTRTCQSDHTWTNSDPTCQSMSECFDHFDFLQLMCPLSQLFVPLSLELVKAASPTLLLLFLSMVTMALERLLRTHVT